MTKEKTVSKLSLWDSVFETDPAHTKHVSIGRGFTTIDAFYQVHRATEVFGPIGLGWGWTADETLSDELVIVKIGLWYVHPETGKRSDPIVHFGCRALRSTKGRTNEEAPKQAATDAMTKALSYIGFNGDVFMGKFDDNKYVSMMTQKFAAKAEVPSVEQQELFAELNLQLSTIENKEQLEALRPRLSEAKEKLPRTLVRGLMDLYIKRNSEFQGGEGE
tara:strand:+ start:2417 stop:3073 length:657 start_codon:yes stop_codon:yes gene_type:complete